MGETTINVSMTCRIVKKKDKLKTTINVSVTCRIVKRKDKTDKLKKTIKISMR